MRDGRLSSRVGVTQPRSVQSYGFAGAAVGLLAEPELLRAAFLPTEEAELACRWQALNQRCGLRWVPASRSAVSSVGTPNLARP